MNEAHRERPIVGGRFELIRQAGSGGMGVVHEGVDLTTGRRVAIKIAFDGRAQRFEREVDLLRAQDHPCIVRYVAHGMTEGGHLYLVTEWLEGGTLGEHLDREGCLTVDALLALGERLASALGSLHERGLLHRDLKPENVLLLERDLARPKLLDFGLARPLGLPGGDPATFFTQPGLVVGTPGYLSPEQARGETALDARADVFALGALFFRCLVGYPPFRGRDALSVMLKTVLTSRVDVEDALASAPGSLGELVARMLSAAPDDRPRDGAEVERELARVRAEITSGAPGGRPARRLTMRERRVASLVLADLGPDADGAKGEALGAIALALGTSADRLSDGTWVVPFSAPAPHDIPVLAARCALSVHGRAVVASGRVAEGEPGAEDELFDRASELLARGSRGVLIDGATRALLGGRFEVAEGEGAFVLLAEHDPMGPDLLARPVAFVGREAEVALIETSFVASIEESSAGAVLVTGVAGVGKTRLLREVAERLRVASGEAEVWVARGDPLKARSSFSFVADALRRAVALDAHPSSMRSALRVFLAARLEPVGVERAIDPLAEILGAAFAHDRGERAHVGDFLQRSVVDVVLATAARRPLVWLLDDAQWIDDASASLLERVLSRARSLPFFIVAAGRPEAHELLARRLEGAGVVHVGLGGLSSKACARLAREALGSTADDDLAKELHRRADGNAFLIEELLRDLRAGRGLDAARTRDAPTAAAEMRIDSLDAASRRALRAASVFGVAFDAAGVAYLLGDAESPATLLDGLVGARILERTTAAGSTHRFRHALLRDAAYARFTDRDLALGHRLAGEFLAERGGEDPRVLAHHFDRGGDAEQAARWYRRSAEESFDRRDPGEASIAVERALTFATDPRERGELHLLRARSLGYLGDYVARCRDAEHALALLEPDTSPWYEAASELAVSLATLDRLDEFVAVMRRLAEADVPREHAGAWVRSVAVPAIQLLNKGELALGRMFVRRMQELVDGLSEKNLREWARIHQVLAAYASVPGEQLEHRLRSAELFDRAGDARAACQARMNAGDALVALGRSTEAIELLRRVTADAEELAIMTVRAASSNLLGMALARTGAFDEAMDAMRVGVATFARQRDRRGEGLARIARAELLLERRKLDRAEIEARAAVELVLESRIVLPWALAVHAAVLLASGRADEALEASTRARAWLEEVGARAERPVFVRAVHADVLDAFGRAAEARAELLLAHASISAIADTIDDPAGRETFLTGVPENRHVLERLAAIGASDARQ